MCDVAAGSGNAAIPAARTGATVVATDLTPELLAAGEVAARAAGVTVKWREADAEAMPCEDGEHDVVMSCVGVMFAPHHRAAAGELLRICRSGGRIGLISWTPEGFIGQMFATMKPYVPAPPPGAQPPPLWGSEEHVRSLFGDGVAEFSAERRSLSVPRFDSAEAFLDFFKRSYGPTIVAYRGLADDPARAAELDEALLALARRFEDADRDHGLGVPAGHRHPELTRVLPAPGVPAWGAGTPGLRRPGFGLSGLRAVRRSAVPAVGVGRRSGGAGRPGWAGGLGMPGPAAGLSISRVGRRGGR